MPRITAAQALVRFLAAQHVERDGVERRFFEGCFGIFGHGNVAGIGQALYQHPDLAHLLPGSNEQAMVHAAVGLCAAEEPARDAGVHDLDRPGRNEHGHRRGAGHRSTACPCCCCPGDMFATRAPAPGAAAARGRRTTATSRSTTAAAGVALLRPRSSAPSSCIPPRWRRCACSTDPAETGAVTLACPQDVQAEAYDCPDEFLAHARVDGRPAEPPTPRRWPRCRAHPRRAAPADRRRRRRHLQRGDRCAARVRRRDGNPGGRDAGRARARCLRPSRCRSAPSARPARPRPTGSPRDADVVIGVGTRWSDFTTASKTAFQDPDVRFVNVNVADFDAAKQSGLRCVADARVALDALREALDGHRSSRRTASSGAAEEAGLGEEVRAARRRRRRRGRCRARRRSSARSTTPPAETGVVVCAAGSMPGDLHKLWRARDPGQGLPRRVRLLVHGLRDPRRAWGSSSPRPSARSSCSSATAPT